MYLMDTISKFENTLKTIHFLNFLLDSCSRNSVSYQNFIYHDNSIKEQFTLITLLKSKFISMT